MKNFFKFSILKVLVAIGLGFCNFFIKLLYGRSLVFYGNSINSDANIILKMFYYFFQGVFSPFYLMARFMPDSVILAMQNHQKTQIFLFILFIIFYLLYCYVLASCIAIILKKIRGMRQK